MAQFVRASRGIAAAILAAGLAACASTAALPPAQVSDPLEPLNRAVFGVNTAFNTVVTYPLARGYETVVPPPIRQGIKNGTANLGEPTIFMNNVLQGRLDAAGTTFGRFVVNSTLGGGGLFDVATLGGLPKQTGDFGQTLFVWGVSDSPFVMMPLLGPATIRDAIGYGVDSIASPAGYAIYRTAGSLPVYALGGFEALNRARDLQTVDETAVDPYARLRSVYYQSRRRELLDGIGRKDDIFDPMITDGTVVSDMPSPPVRPARRPPAKRNTASAR